MRKKSKHFFIISISMILIYSCNDTSDINDNNKTLSGYLTKIIVDHVVEKREGCKFTTFYFEVILINTTNSNQQIELTPSPDHCERDIKESNIWWVKGTERKPLTLASIKYDTIIIVRTNEQVKINLKGVFRVQGGSLNQIKTIYEEWINSAKIVYQGDNLSIKKAENFELVFLLDDNRVTPDDTIAFNKTVSPPNLKTDTFLDERKIPITEPELY